LDTTGGWLLRVERLTLRTFVRIAIVPDKFKGTLTARQAAAAIAAGWKRTRPADSIEQVPMSDGGDGFGKVIGNVLGATTRRITTVDAAHRPRQARWWWSPQTRTAIVESAEVIGLSLLGARHRRPLELDTSGLGRVLLRVSRLKPRRCLIGVGGSATNDGGFGMARALGWRFLAGCGPEMTQWTQLARCRRIVSPPQRPTLGRLTVAFDVENPLLGAAGCTRIYGPQKGLQPGEFPTAERALRRLAHLMEQQLQRGAHRIPGAGASGGLGFGLMTFLGARPAKGFSVFARETGLARHIRTADLVITGEGCLDAQSLMGKGVGELLGLCEANRTPCMVISGHTALPLTSRRRFVASHTLTSRFPRSMAMTQTSLCLERLAASAALPWGPADA
jgi:glycerate kinase